MTKKMTQSEREYKQHYRQYRVAPKATIKFFYQDLFHHPNVKVVMPIERKAAHESYLSRTIGFHAIPSFETWKRDWKLRITYRYERIVDFWAD